MGDRGMLLVTSISVRLLAETKGDTARVASLTRCNGSMIPPHALLANVVFCWLGKKKGKKGTKRKTIEKTPGNLIFLVTGLFALIRVSDAKLCHEVAVCGGVGDGRRPIASTARHMTKVCYYGGGGGPVGRVVPHIRQAF